MAAVASTDVATTMSADVIALIGKAIQDEDLSTRLATKIRENGPEFGQVMYADLVNQSERALEFFLDDNFSFVVVRTMLENAARLVLRSVIVAHVARLDVDDHLPEMKEIMAVVAAGRGAIDDRLDEVKTLIKDHVARALALPICTTGSSIIRGLLTKEMTRLLLTAAK